MTIRPLIIDCDTGRDDALTIWLAKKLKLPLIGVVASYGNVKLEQVVENTNRVLSFVDWEDIPVWSGASEPSQPHPLISKILVPRQTQAGNGLCNIVLPTAKKKQATSIDSRKLVDRLVKLSTIHGALDYYVIGPATNIASIIKILGADASSVIAKITMLGGKFDDLWNNTPIPDFNVACDPFSVQYILSSSVPVWVVPLNATWPVYLTLEDIEQLPAELPLFSLVKKLMVAHCKYFSHEPKFYFHDPSVLLTAQHMENYKTTRLNVNCDIDDPNFGQITESESGQDTKVYVMNGQCAAEFLNIILSHLTG